MPGTITSDLTAGLINSAEAITNWLNLGTWGSDPLASADIYLENAYALNALASAAVGPVERLAWALAATAAGLDLTINERHLFFWVKCFSLPAMNTRAKGGIRICISADVTPTKTGTDPWSGPTNSKSWFVTGKDFEPTSGWVCYVVDPTSTPDLTLGTATMSSVDRAGIGADALLVVGGGSIKPKPTMFDKIAYGTGLTINAGMEGAPVTFADIYATDSANANCFGVLTQAAGIYFAAGKFLFGTTGQTAITYFKDTNQVIVFQDFRVASTFYEIKLVGAGSFVTTVQLGNYSGGLTSGGVVIRGSGLTTRRAIAPVIVAGGTGYAAGNILTVSGGTFTTAAQVKVITISGGVITELRMETAGSYSVPPTGTLTLTGGGGSSATCTLTFVGGSIWTLTASATNQTLKLYGCSFSEMRRAVLASTTEIRGCVFDNFGDIEANGAVIQDCTFQNLATATPISGTYALIVDSPAELKSGETVYVQNNKFINCNKAIKLTTYSADPYKFVGLKFSGNAYDVEKTFNGDLVIDVTGGGDTPTVLNSGTGSVTINNQRTLTLSGLVVNSEVRIYVAGTINELAGVENSGATFQYGYNFVTGTYVDIVVHKADRIYYRLENYLLLNSDASLPIVQQLDRQYSNP